MEAAILVCVTSGQFQVIAISDTRSDGIGRDVQNEFDIRPPSDKILQIFLEDDPKRKHG